MDEDVLLRFLGHGLINFSGDSTKLQSLRATADEIAAILAESPGRVVSCTLVAVDPLTSEDDPVVTQVLEMLQARWPTMRNTFAGPPVAVARAILLDALQQASSNDSLIGAVFAHTARNMLPLMELGEERKVWAPVIAEAEREASLAAEERWTTSVTISVPPMAMEASSWDVLPVRAPKADLPALTTDVRASIGPRPAPSGGGSAEPASNPYWPTGTSRGKHLPLTLSFEPWATQFATRLAQTMADTITSAVDQATVKTNLPSLTEAVSRQVTDALTAVNGALQGLEAHTRLLWWKESLYSPSARTSYRALPLSEAATLMAVDLYDSVGLTAPASVVELLSEAAASLDREQTFPIRELIAAAPRTLRVPARNDGRVPLLALAGRDALDDDTFRRRTGVPPATRLSLSRWACWVFRELTAAGSAELSRTRRTERA